MAGIQAGRTVGREPQLDENEVMRALLIHEKRAVSGAAPAGGAQGGTRAPANASDSESDTSESDEESPPRPAPPVAARGPAEEDEEDDDEDFEEVGEEEPMVLVGGRLFSYREVSQRPELVEQMTAQEKEAYIEMGQNIFQDMFF